MSGKQGQFSQSQDFCEIIKYESPVAPPKGKSMAFCFLESITLTEMEAQSGYVSRHKGLQMNM